MKKGRPFEQPSVGRQSDLSSTPNQLTTKEGRLVGVIPKLTIPHF
jgi:hypothetical protein